MAYQRAYIPIDTVKLSQGYGSQASTHQLGYQLDFVGVQDVYAPFNCKITKLYQPKDTVNHANTVWLTSTNKVLCKNGAYDYLTISFTHPSEISSMKLGTIYQQGDKICTTSKMTGLATGKHLHLELAKGKTANWVKITKNKHTEYVIKNKVKPEEYLFLRESAKVTCNTYKNGTYDFKKESDMEYKTTTDLWLHKSADTKASTRTALLPSNQGVTVFYIIGDMAYIYSYSKMGYVSKKYISKN